MSGFMNQASDVQWLKDTALKGVILPSRFHNFQSFTLIGNEDAPTRLEVYLSAEPLFTDEYLKIDFPNDGLIYCEYAVVKP